MIRIAPESLGFPAQAEPGDYEEDELRDHLLRYLTSSLKSSRRIRDVLLPACLEQGQISRAQLVSEFLNRGAAEDESAAGRFVSLISSQLGMQKNDFLRQVIGYEYPEYHWRKDNYFVRPEHRDLVERVLTQARTHGGEEGD